MREPTPSEEALSQLELTSLGLNPFADKRLIGVKFEEPERRSGLKFGEPEIPLGKLHEAKFHMKHRYEEGITQMTKLLMRDGKLSKAQRVSVSTPFQSCHEEELRRWKQERNCEGVPQKLTSATGHGHDPQLPPNVAGATDQPAAAAAARVPAGRAPAPEPEPVPDAGAGLGGAPDPDPRVHGPGGWWQGAGGAGADREAGAAADGVHVDHGHGGEEDVDGVWQETAGAPDWRGDRRGGRGQEHGVGQEEHAAQAGHECAGELELAGPYEEEDRLELMGMASFTGHIGGAVACLRACLPATCSTLILWTCRLEKLGRVSR